MSMQAQQRGPERFDEQWYLHYYDDVREAVARGEWQSGYAHYCSVGKATGREGAPQVDEAWYAGAYPLAAREVARGAAANLAEHYFTIGRYRGYVPRKNAPRPRNPCSTRSSFGGLWTDAANALDLIDGKLRLGMLDEAAAKLLRMWVSEGYVILAGAVSPELVEKALEAVDEAYDGEGSGLKFACHGVRGDTPWLPQVKSRPAKALDLHWHSDAIRQLIFAPRILEFLHLVFERPAMATQTLSFYRGSAQEAHQDSAYVNYSLPMQFAASWIALEDVFPGAGELFYLAGSHRMPEYLYAATYKGAEDAKRVEPERDLSGDYARHISLIAQQREGMQLEERVFAARRGDVLIWSADLAHGGKPISKSRTRRSVVTHYCPAELAPSYFEQRTAPVRAHGNAFYSTGIYA